MKTSFFFFAIIALLSFASCDREDQVLINGDLDTPTTRAANIVETNSNYPNSSKVNFTFSKSATVTLTGTVGRGFNEWWDISKYTNQTYVVVGKGSSIVKQIFLDAYIWNANPESYMDYSENFYLEAGTYWIDAVFAPALGPQYGASLNHGITIATLKQTY